MTAIYFFIYSVCILSTYCGAGRCLARCWGSSGGYSGLAFAPWNPLARDEASATQRSQDRRRWRCGPERRRLLEAVPCEAVCAPNAWSVPQEATWQFVVAALACEHGGRNPPEISLQLEMEIARLTGNCPVTPSPRLSFF